MLVDTTCGSVLNVWKNVHKYARDGFTAVIHGKHYHEETKATASQALTHDGGHYLCVRDREEAEVVCDFIRGHGRRGRDPRALRPRRQPRLRSRARPRAHRPRQPDDDADEREPGDPGDAAARPCSTATARPRRPARFRAMDTICSATQDRQDAVLRMLDEGGLDLMVVIGGYNSSNTQALARICAARLPTYHIDGAGLHRGRGHPPPPGRAATTRRRPRSWLPAGPVTRRPHRRRLHPQQRGGGGRARGCWPCAAGRSRSWRR